MPHQCLSCNKIYKNATSSLLKGCEICGKKLFLYIKNVPEKGCELPELSKEEKKSILDETEKLVGLKDKSKPVILDLENIKILKQGKYEIDINQLLKKEKPIIYKVENGTYVIDYNFLTNN